MKKKLLITMMAMVAVLALTACGSGSKLNGVVYSNYIEAVMDCDYHGELDRYTDVIDATESEAKESYDSTVGFYANELLVFNGSDYEAISDETYNKYVELAREIMKKTKYTVKDATKVDEDYVVSIEITPIDFNDITEADVENCFNEFAKQFESMDVDSLSDEQWAAYEEEYALKLYDVLSAKVDEIGYKETITKDVTVIIDSDGRHGIDENDWYEIDDLVVGMEFYKEQ